MKTHSSFRQFMVVFSHEYCNLVRNKFFRAFTLVFLLVIAAVLIIPPLIGTNSQPAPTDVKKSVLVADTTGKYTQADFASVQGYTVTLQESSAAAAQLQARIGAGKYDAAILISRDAQGKINLHFITTRVWDSLPQDMVTFVAAANIKNTMTRYHVPSSEIAQALTPPDLTVTETSGSINTDILPPFILIMILFYATIGYGMMVASGVAQEKSSRAMELLITSARTQNLILGKIIGIGLAGVTQLAVWLAGLFVCYKINYAYWMSSTLLAGLFSNSASTIAYMLLFFLLGFFTFATLYGAVGSLVSRSEDIQTMQLPMVFLLLIGLFGTVMGMILPGALLTVFSFIPIYTPMSMFARISTTYVPWWQIGLSFLISAATISLFAWAAIKIYRVGVLMYGKTPTVKEVIRALHDDKRG